MLRIMSVSATVALDDWSTRVRIVPIITKSSTDHTPCPDHDWMNESASGLDSRLGTEFFMNESPRKRRLNPTMISLMSRVLPFFERLITKPTAISGTARMDMSAEKPKSAIIQAVNVVPMLAPIITPMAWVRVRIPAFTKLTTITVVALDDWITAVTPSPVTTPLKGLEVMDATNFLRPSPAVFWSPELIMFIP